MNFKNFTIISQNGYFEYPLPAGAPFCARITLKGVSAPEVIERRAAEGPFLLLKQIHSRRVVEAALTSRYPVQEEADGYLIVPGDPCCALRFGDCAPVIIVNVAEPWALSLHSGFPGTSKNITEAGMALAREKFGTPDPKDLYALIGPCISGDCYSREADDPATQEALETFIPEAVSRAGGLVHFDLKRQIVHQLTEQGIPEDHISVETQCTCCRSELFYSHRRAVLEGGDDPRMLLTVEPVR